MLLHNNINIEKVVLKNLASVASKVLMPKNITSIKYLKSMAHGHMLRLSKCTGVSVNPRTCILEPGQSFVYASRIPGQSFLLCCWFQQEHQLLHTVAFTSLLLLQHRTTSRGALLKILKRGFWFSTCQAQFYHVSECWAETLSLLEFWGH